MKINGNTDRISTSRCGVVDVTSVSDDILRFDVVFYVKYKAIYSSHIIRMR